MTRRVGIIPIVLTVIPMPHYKSRFANVNLGFTQIQESILVQNEAGVALLVQQAGILREIHE